MKEEKKRMLFLQGNEAVAAGALAAGANFCAGYPITPATEIAEALSSGLPKAGGKFIQMEDELACMGAIIGASLMGAKSITATSGPGFSLMQENLGYASMAEVPCVIVDVQRGGPSTGVPTAVSQGDVMQSRWGTHGDHSVIVLTPSTVQEMYYLTIECFNYAEKYRVPVILLTDAILGHMRERVEVPEPGTIKVVNRKKPTVSPEEYMPYCADEDGVPPMANFGEGYRYYVSGTMHNEKGQSIAGDPVITARKVARLHDKLTKNLDDIIKYETTMTEDAEILVLAYGCVARAAQQAVTEARKSGIKVGLFRPITMWPYPEKAFMEAVNKAHTLIVPEMNIGQYAGEAAKVLYENGGKAKIVKVTELGCEMIHPARILQAITEVAGNDK